MYMLFIGILVEAIITFIVYTSYIILLAFILWMAIDAGKQDRFWWVVFIIGVPIIGCVVYFYTEKKHEYVKAKSRNIHVSETEQQHETSPKKPVRKRKKADVAKEQVMLQDNTSKSDSDSATV